MKDREQYKNLSGNYNCTNCNTQSKAGMHCGHPMHLAEEGGKLEWNCWMGSSCGRKDFEACCDTPKLVAV